MVSRVFPRLNTRGRHAFQIIMLQRIAKLFDRAATGQVFALAWAVAIVCGMAASLHSNAIIGGEGHDGYLELAQNLVAGNGYVFAPNEHKVFHRPPLYPLLLTPGALLSGPLVRVYIILLNSALFAGTVALLFSFASEFFSKRAATLAAALLLGNPFLLYGVKNPVSAICQMFLFFSVVTLTWRVFYSPRTRTLPKLLLYTLSLYASIMSHGTMLPIAALILGSLFLRALRKRPGPTLGQVCTIAVSLCLLIVPWTYRNYKVTGLFLPVAGNTGLAYFAGNAHWGITLPPRRPGEERADSEFRHAGLPLERRRELMKYYGLTDPAFEKIINKRAHEHLREHPIDFAKKILLNAVEYYFPIVFHIAPPQGSQLDDLTLLERIKAAPGETLPLSLYHLFLIGGAVFGFHTLRRNPAQRPLAHYLAALWILYAALYFPFLVFVGHSLYTYGTLPILSLFAAAWLTKRLTPGAPDKTRSANHSVLV
jgi:hypothetical protein